MTKRLALACTCLTTALAAHPAHALTQVQTPGTPGVQPPLVSANIREHASEASTAPADDPYPVQDAGWGPPAGPDRFASRWVEDWSGLKAKGKAPPLKAMPLFGRDDINLTLSGEMRLRNDAYDNAVLMRGNDYHQVELRGIVGADLHLGEHFRVYGELGTAQVDGHGDGYTANFKGAAVPGNYRNDVSVQQLFGEARTTVGGALVGVMAGRQEFADGPRQLVSLGEGPTLHKSWNGVRGYVHLRNFRFGAYSFRPTLLNLGSFDDPIDHSQKIWGLNASMVVRRSAARGDLYLDGYLLHSDMAKGAAGASVAPDHRDTYGLRYWGRYGPLSIDWSAMRQTGDHAGRDVSAWYASLIQNVLVKYGKVPIRIGGHIELASGGNSYGKTGTIRGFNQLFASSAYLGQGLLLSESNLVMIAPAVAVAPVKTLTLNAEYAFLRRMRQDDAVYAGSMKPYAGTQNVRGYSFGSYARGVASWSVTRNLTLDAEVERLFAGKVLHRAGYGSGSYAMLSLTVRY